MSTFKAFRLYLLPQGFVPTHTNADLLEHPLPDIQPIQKVVSGWVPALHQPSFDDASAGFYPNAGVYHRYGITKKAIPTSVINAELERRVIALQKVTGEPPSFKVRREMKAEVETDLLPNAFPKTTLAGLYFDNRNDALLIGSISEKTADVVRVEIRSVYTDDEIRLRPVTALRAVQWDRMPDIVMTELVEAATSGEFDFGGLEFDGTLWLYLPGDENGLVWKSNAADLDSQELSDMLLKGMRVCRIGLANEHLRFVLDDELVVRSIKPLDVFLANIGAQADAASEQDVDFLQYEATAILELDAISDIVTRLKTVFGLTYPQD